MRIRSWTVLSVVAAALAAGCASDDGAKINHDPVATSGPWTDVTDAVASVTPLGKSKAHGVVRFSQVEGGVKVTADVEGLKPASKHAFHIHEFGDITGADGKSAGSHYNPGHADHGGPDSPSHHAGDLGNLDADGKGNAHYERVIPGLTIAGDHDAVLGRSVVIHAGTDDFSTQPSGTVGDGATRIACGVIGVAKSSVAK